MSSFFSAFAKKESEASLWAKEHRPKVVIGKDPLNLKTEPKFNKTKLPIFDGVLGPAVGIVNSLATMNNSITHFTENMKAFAAMTNGGCVINKMTDAKGFDVEVGNLGGLRWQFGIFDPDMKVLATIDAVDKVVIVDQAGWDAQVEKCTLDKKVGTLNDLAASLGDWMAFINEAMNSMKEFSAEAPKVILDPVKQFPQLVAFSEDPDLCPDKDAPTGILNDRAPWVSRPIAYKQRTWLNGFCGFCKNKEFERDISLEELLKRKKARTRSGRGGQRRSAKRMIKKLKAEEKAAMAIYEDKDRMRKVFDENDLDKSGTLDFDELKKLFEKLKIEKSDLEIEEMITAADDDGSGTIEFDEFANVQKQVAETKKAEWEKWYSDPVLKRVRRYGCQKADRKRFYKLSWTDDQGKHHLGSKTENRLMKMMMVEQKGKDAVVKDWCKVITDALGKVNLILTALRKGFVDAVAKNMSIRHVFDMVRAKLSDLAKKEGLNVDNAKGPAVKFIKNFKMMFKGKNPITGMALVDVDGKQVKYAFDNVGKGPSMDTTDTTLRYIYTTFFDFGNPGNLVNVFGKLAIKVSLLCFNCVMLGIKVTDLALKCMPPFPIIGVIQTQVMQVCIKGAMTLDFSLRKVPGNILSNVAKFGGFASACMAFAFSSKGLIKSMMAMCPKENLKAIKDKGGEEAVEEEDDDDDKVDPSELGDNFAKGASRSDAADAKAKTANDSQSELQLSKKDKKEEAFHKEVDDDAEDHEDNEDFDKDDDADGAAKALDMSDVTLDAKFAEIDADGDGSLTAQEFKNALLAQDMKFTDAQISQMLSIADLDKNEALDLEEFKRAMRAAATTKATTEATEATTEATEASPGPATELAA